MSATYFGTEREIQVGDLVSWPERSFNDPYLYGRVKSIEGDRVICVEQDYGHDHDVIATNLTCEV